ncbi:type 1 periplasmic binding fold superfamily protein [Flavobacterium sp.]|uniref:type 1 periplasmic binding fold superfamily protein n=1 Tax=Flavobacterium sp. TaxID=239 RepID=UPI0038FD11D5
MKTSNQINKVQVLKKSVVSTLLLMSFFTFLSCNNDDPTIVNEEELITTVTIVLKNGEQTITLKSTDLDGLGPNKPVQSITGTIYTNTVYTGTVTFLNELITPADNITEEVLTEGVDHQLFFQAPAALGSFAYADTDANSKPIGLQFTFTTGSTAASGNLTATLKHEPNKSAFGVSGGSISNAGGETDAEVTYSIQTLAKSI